MLRRNMLRNIRLDEFKNLKPGDKFWGLCNDNFTLNTVSEPPFYNVDADEPDWEVLSSGCFWCWDSVYVRDESEPRA